MNQRSNAAIQRYYLYGDQLDDVEMDFLHIEPIRERSGAHDWTIRAHAHPDHVQILLVERGGGKIVIEGVEFPIPTLSIVVIPAAMVHEIHFTPDTDGMVITAATAYATTVAHGDTRMLDALAEPQVYQLNPAGPGTDGVIAAFRQTHEEYVWSAQGRRAAIMAYLLTILVTIMRLRSDRVDNVVAASDRDYEILCRYRELLEGHFRTEKALGFYAGQIGLSAQRLNQACKARAGKTASELLHERAIIEAKRYLIYMEMTVAEVGYELGFDDPAYFSRFFAQRVGVPPGAYRAEHQAQRNQQHAPSAAE